LKIPQANDVARILDVPLAIEQGDRSAQEVAERYGFEYRQALYYLQAAELLGLVLKRGERYLLSKNGHTYVAFTQPQRKDMIARRMLSLPIIFLILQEILISPLHRLGRDEIEKLVVSKTGIRGETVHRRVQSLFSWFSWLGDEIGLFKVSRDSITIGS
jgi:hypothetical protein